MISVDTKTPTQVQPSASPSLITLPSEEGESKKSLTFSELLKGISSKSDDKVLKKGTLVLALDKDVKKDGKKDLKGVTIETLLKPELGTTLKEESLEINPQLTQNLTATELKTLVGNAKKYLKIKIIESEGFKKSEIQRLPKTVKGLVSVAKKFGLDISKITIEEIAGDSKTTTKLETPKASKESLLPQKATLKDMLVSKEKQVEPQKEPQKATLKDMLVSKEKQVEPQKEPQKATLKDMLVSKEKQVEPQKEPQKIAEVHTKQIKATKNLVTENILQEPIEEINKLQKSKRESIPLFKTQTKVAITTEQLVNSKINTIIEQKLPKKKVDNSLKILLSGEKISYKATQKDMGFTADFSIATARVIAPQATTNAHNSLESLLRGDQDDTPSTTSTSSKIDAPNISKADSFEVKLNEAKQMTKYLSQDVKTAIDDYKSPFTRIKLQLNPQRLGEVDLTIVQRGKNLHINLSSNNAAINTLALNVNDLKGQLANSGINNATLNFSNNSSDSNQSAFGQQQQNSQQRQQAQDEYNYFDSEERSEEIVNSLEIVVPNYA